MVTPAPTQALQNINLNVKLGALASVSVITQADHSFATECINLSIDYQSVLCPVPNPDYRNISSVKNVTYTYANLNLHGTSATIALDYTGGFNVNKTLLGLPALASLPIPTLPPNMTISANDTEQIQKITNNQQAQASADPLLSLDVHSLWLFSQSDLRSFSINSSKLANVSNIIFSLDAESCLSVEATDTIYQLSLSVDSSTTVTANGFTGDALLSLAKNITANGTVITNSNGVVSFPSTINLIANLIFTKITKVTPTECVVTTQPPTPAPQLTSGMARYGVLTDSANGKNTLGKYYGFDSSRVNTVFSYNDVDKYAALVTSDSCFKVKVWLVFFPLWIDASIITSILGGFTEVLNTVTGVFLEVVNQTKSLASQVSVKNIVAQSVKVEAAARALTTEEGRAALIAATENYLEKQSERIKAVANFKSALQSFNKVKDAVEKMESIVTSLKSFLDKSNGTTINFNDLYQSSSQDIWNIIMAFKDLIDIVTNIDTYNEIIDLVKLVISDILDIFDILKNMVVRFGSVGPIEIIRSRDLVMQNYSFQILLKVKSIINRFDFININFQALSDLLKQNEAIKAATEIAEIGAKQNKTQLEQALIGFAEDASAEIDKAVDAIADVLQINQLENLANAGLNLAVSGVSSAANALGSAAAGVEAAKRNKIRGMISSYLIKTIDLYKITRLGRFDENNPTERQLLINDLAGTRIYSRDGSTLLFERKDFCKNPFISLGNNFRLNDFGCQSDTDPCGVGGYNCQELNYWYDSFKYRISFDFYGNHDLSLGGIVIGDFDGDGVDDIMCHLPGTTKNYDKITKDYSQRTSGDRSEIVINNEIIYSPLKALTSNGRFQSIEQSMLVHNNNNTLGPQKDWCKDGIIRVGDFNGDKKDDLLCISKLSSYLFYSDGYTFYPAGNNTASGAIAHIPSAGNLQNLVVVVGDFDGNGYSDILNITKTGANIFYGDSEKIFTQNVTKTNSWLSSYSTQLASCYNLGVNRIIVADTNNDGRDDVSCISSDNSNVNTIYSTLPRYNNTDQIEESLNYIKIYVNDITLSPYNFDYAPEAQQNIKINHQTHRNVVGAGGMLIFNENMLPEKKSVSDISVSLDCLNLGSLNSEIHVSFSGEYLIPETLLWNKERSTSILSVNLDVSAEFKGKHLIQLLSTKIQSFEYKLKAAQGGCYTTETVTHTTTIAVNYNATAKLVAENKGQLLQGRDLEKFTKSILADFDIEDDSVVSFQVNGQMIINVLGVGYDVVNHCDQP